MQSYKTDEHKKCINILKSIIPHIFCLLFVNLCQYSGLFMISLSTLHLVMLHHQNI